ncbi:MAG: hydrolase 1, exosortase A system-associated [Rubrivivax sp.]|nr:hydrolase 1, exosortase A system-associated [Rubrivivax sp.]
MAETAITFECEDERLLGILHKPDATAAPQADGLGVVVIVGGPQYRAGSHRQFVHLARRMAAAGHAVLRFDVRGMGDSTGSQRHFEHLGADIGAAIDALQRQEPGVRRVVLWGLCDGASAALLYLHERPDPRVAGVCLLNPWVRSPTSLARAHVKHYYLQRLGERAFWAKLFSGGVALRAVRELLGNLRLARSPALQAGSSKPFQSRMAIALQTGGLQALVVLSGNDYTAKEFIEYTRSDPAWIAALARAQRREIDDADHTFSGARARDDLEAAVCAWLGQLRRPEARTA